MKKNFALYLLLALAGATCASATSIPVILNPDFTPTTSLVPDSLLSVQGSDNPDSWDGASTPVVADWNFTVLPFMNLSGIAGPDLSESGGAADYIHFTVPPDGATQFAFLSSGTSVGQLIDGFQSGTQYILTFSAESYCPTVDPLTVTFNGLDSTTEYPTTASAYSDPQSGWETFSVEFAANSTVENINFSTTFDINDFPPGYDLTYDQNSEGPFVAFSDPVITATPEPGSLYLVATGLLGLLFMAHSRSRKTHAQLTSESLRT